MRRSCAGSVGEGAGAPDPTLDLGVQALEMLFVVRSRRRVGLGERVRTGGREAPLKHVDCLGELLVRPGQPGRRRQPRAPHACAWRCGTLASTFDALHGGQPTCAGVSHLGQEAATPRVSRPDVLSRDHEAADEPSCSCRSSEPSVMPRRAVSRTLHVGPAGPRNVAGTGRGGGVGVARPRCAASLGCAPMQCLGHRIRRSGLHHHRIDCVGGAIPGFLRGAWTQL